MGRVNDLLSSDGLSIEATMEAGLAPATWLL
jgi:hypothetical protein